MGTLSPKLGVVGINTPWHFRYLLQVQMPIYTVSTPPPPKTIRDWNELPDSLISSAELSDDCVSKFTSLVRARGLNPSGQAPSPLVWYCQFDVSPVNYSDSDATI